MNGSRDSEAKLQPAWTTIAPGSDICFPVAVAIGASAPRPCSLGINTLAYCQAQQASKFRRHFAVRILVYRRQITAIFDASSTLVFSIGGHQTLCGLRLARNLQPSPRRPQYRGNSLVCTYGNDRPTRT